MTSVSGQSRERFPQAPSDCRERGERVSVWAAWGTEGYDVEHPGMAAVFVSSASTVGGFWPAGVIEAFRAYHADQDRAQALPGGSESTPEPEGGSGQPDDATRGS